MTQDRMPKDELNRLQKAFAIFDINGDGDITHEELADVLKSLGSRPPLAILLDMIDRGDSDRNGKIDFPEFIMLMNGPPDTVKDDIDAKERLEKRVSQREEELCDLFRVFDTDGSGFISAEEISRIMTKFSGLTPEEAQILLNEADIDRDGEVAYEEFVNMMKRPGDEPMRRRASSIWNTMMSKYS